MSKPKKCSRCRGTGFEPNQKEAGLWFRTLRIASGMSLRRVAKLAGISPSFLSNLEKGNRKWTDEVRDKCRKAINQ
jgi:hypothetical protein